ncbi:MAG TPA: FlgD immunoglobulin-like domain containing protein [Candidatus Eisenbacteria bacterium]|nr:FlgD immunoglobulin-like domain containing protein [Candidatus Eisenbacteria bacterium]
MNLRTRTCTTVASCVLATILGAAIAQAHNWSCWRQPNRTVPAYVTAALSSQANAAVSEWDTRTILSVPRVNYHTEMSVFDGYYGNTGWAGIASIESASGCNILHGHARVNRSYSYTSNGYRGIFCQEVGHLFGLDHSNDGGCMGGGYFYSINTYYTLVQHNINDIATKYANAPAATAPDDLASLTPEVSGESGPLSGEIPEGTARAVAFWHDRPNTMEEALSRSLAVVSGRVLRVNAGADLVNQVEGLEDGVDRIPTQRILFAVDKVIAGELKARVVELFRTGNEDYILAEDPPYAEGERYVLFLTRADRGMYRTIAPEGRLKVTESGLELTSTREFMSELRGRSVESISSEVAQLSPMTGVPSGPLGLQLRQNAANPFKSRTSVSYALPGPSDVSLGVFDAQGRRIRGLVEGWQDGPRWYTVEWDGRDDRDQQTANGVYYIRLVTPQGMKSVSVVRIN